MSQSSSVGYPGQRRRNALLDSSNRIRPTTGQFSSLSTRIRRRVRRPVWTAMIAMSANTKAHTSTFMRRTQFVAQRTLKCQRILERKRTFAMFPGWLAPRLETCGRGRERSGGVEKHRMSSRWTTIARVFFSNVAKEERTKLTRAVEEGSVARR